MAALAKQIVHNEHIQCVVPRCGRWESRYNMPGHLLVDDTHKNLPFTEQHRALWEVDEEEKAILQKGMTAWGKELAAKEKECEKMRMKGKRQNLKDETRLQRDIVANADNVAEQAAAAKALKAPDKAAALVMAVQEQHDADYDPDENEDNTSQSSSSSSSNNDSRSSDNSSTSNSSNSSSKQSSSDTRAEKRKKKKIPKTEKRKMKNTKAKSPVKQQAPRNTSPKRPTASQGGKPKKR